MSAATGRRPRSASIGPERLGREARKLGLSEERLGGVSIDGARHSLIWVHDVGRSISLLLDRLDEGQEQPVRLVGAFGPGEDFEVVEALAGDYEEHHCRADRAERIPPRPLDHADLLAPPVAGTR